MLFRSKAPQAAGVIHTDFEKGFIKAEVIAFRDFTTLGSEAAAQIGQVVEGLTTAPVLRDLSHRLGIELPITEGVCRILEGDSLGDLVASLMGRRPRGE